MIRRAILISLILFPFIAAGSPSQDRAASSYDFTGKVVGVSDGDTISVMKEGLAVKVRLFGVDCPEKRQAFGTRAKEFTSKQVFSKEVRVTIVDTDRYGRLVGWVHLGQGVSLNHQLVTEGLAWWYSRYAPGDKDLKRLEAEARAAKRGLWVDQRPVPPWVFRRTVGTQFAR